MSILRLAIESINNSSVIKDFYKKYPVIENNDKRWYSGKCGVISFLFAEHLTLFNKRPKLITGFGIKDNYLDTWADKEVSDWLRERKKEFLNNRDAVIHVAVLISNEVYDLSSQQFGTPSFTIYPKAEFEKRFLRVIIEDFDEIKDSFFSTRYNGEYNREIRDEITKG